MVSWRGKMKHRFAFAGENAYRAEKIVSVKNLVNSLIEEYGTVAVT